jgi:hypothetical protein
MKQTKKKHSQLELITQTSGLLTFTCSSCTISAIRDKKVLFKQNPYYSSIIVSIIEDT